MAMLVKSFECKFLFIKLKNAPSFISAGLCESVLPLLNDSLINIILKHDIRVIISNSPQVKLAKELIRADKNYPQIKLYVLLLKDIYEGIYLSKQDDDNFTIHTLSFSIDDHDSIPISTDTTWIVQIHQDYMMNAILISGSSLEILIEISRILFKNDINIQAFKSSCLFVDQSYSYSYTISENNESDQMSTIVNDFECLYHLEIKEKRIEGIEGEKEKERERIIHFTEKIQDTIADSKKNKIYFLNGKKHSYLSLKGTLTLLKKLQRKSDWINISTESVNQFQLSNDLAQIIVISDLDSDKFLDAFQNVFSKILFDSFVNVPFSIRYWKSTGVLNILCGERFLVAIREYLIDLLIKYKIINSGQINEIFNPGFGVIKAEDCQGHTIQYELRDSYCLSNILLFREMERIVMFFNGTLSKEIKMEKTSTFIMTRPTLSKLVSRIEKMKLENLKNIENASDGIEIIFDRKGDKAIINKLKRRDPIVRFAKYNSMSFDLYFQWKFILIDFGSNSVLCIKNIASFEMLLYFWKRIPKGHTIMVQNRAFSGAFSLEELIEFKEDSDKDGILKKLLKLLLSHTKYEIRGFALRHEMILEVYLDKQELVVEFKKLLNSELKTLLSSTCKTSQRKEEKEGKKEKTKEKEDLKSKRKKGFRSNVVNTGSRTLFPSHYYSPSHFFYFINQTFPCFGNRSNNESLNIKRSNRILNLSKENALNFLLIQPPSPSPPSSPLLPSPMIRIVEIMGGCPPFGNLEIVYYKKLDLKEYFQTLDHDQLVRAGRGTLTDYKNRNKNEKSITSFFFTQYSISKSPRYERMCFWYNKDYIVCSVDLNNIGEYEGLFRIILRIFMENVASEMKREEKRIHDQKRKDHQ